MATVLGHSSPLAGPPPSSESGRTLVDDAPYGASAGKAEPDVATSQRPTPMVPAPIEEQGLAATMSDPFVSERAQQLREAALAEARKGAAAPQVSEPRVAPASEPKLGPKLDRRGGPLLGKTLVQGGKTLDAPTAPSSEGPTQVPTAAPAPAPAPTTPLEASTTPVEAPTKPVTDKQTMLGMPAANLPAPKPAAAAPTLPSAMKTMLGVAIPGIAPTQTPAAPADVRAGTLLGIAVPGIAPTHGAHAPPGAAPGRPPPDPHHAAQPVAPPVVPPPPPLVVEPLPVAPRLGPRKGVPAIAVVGIVAVLVAILGAIVAVLVLRSGAPLTAQPLLDESGKESLKIRCTSCPDETRISLGASSAIVKASEALLPLPAPLSIGDNDLEMTVDRPAPGRDETVKLRVPVAYRVKADLSTLTAAPPVITVRVEAVPDSEVSVDGKPVSLDDAGKGAVAMDVAAEVEGPSADQKTIDKRIPFTIKAKGVAAPESGELVVRAGVVPIHVDAPGVELVTERPSAAVAGQTKPGAALTIDGQRVMLDGDGRFGVRIDLPAAGDKTITLISNAPPLAPRTVRAKVVRVDSPDAGVRMLDARAPLGFDVFGADPAPHVGKLVVVSGDIVDIRVAQGHTVLLVEEKGCTTGACVVRVSHGEEVKAARGDTARAWGHLRRTVTFGGKPVPDVEGSLVLTRPRGRK